MALIYLSLGSNIGDRAANLRRAISMMAPEIVVETLSPVYETEPMYVITQPKFFNMACRASTGLSPLELLHKTKAIEKELETKPHIHNQPRVIDIDILFYDDAAIATTELTIPHPRIAERAFVLVPLADIAPEFAHPNLGATIIELKNRLGDVLKMCSQCNK